MSTSNTHTRYMKTPTHKVTIRQLNNNRSIWRAYVHYTSNLDKTMKKIERGFNMDHTSVTIEDC